MDRTPLASDVLLGFLRDAAERREAAERHFRQAIAGARSLDLPLSLVADAVGLSISRVQAIADEARSPVGVHDQTTSPEHDVLVVAAGRAAAAEYLEYGAYVCQAHRSFRDVPRMGFYRRRRIEPYFPLIRERHPAVEFSHENATGLRARGDLLGHELGDLVEAMLRDGRRHEGGVFEVFLLTRHDDSRTLVLEHPIHHTAVGRGSAWAQGTRYTSEASLRRNPRTTGELD